MKVGYIRKAQDRILMSQIDKIYKETSPSEGENGPVCLDMIKSLRKGDQLVIAALDSLGFNAVESIPMIKELTNKGVEVIILKDNITVTDKNFGEAITASFKSCIFSARRENIRMGIAKAKEKGIVGGKKGFDSETIKKIIETHKLYNSGNYNADDIGVALGIGRATVYRYLKVNIRTLGEKKESDSLQKSE
jgi:DNA invertase Pin-like site-specific DNA recombinase